MKCAEYFGIQARSDSPYKSKDLAATREKGFDLSDRLQCRQLWQKYANLERTNHVDTEVSFLFTKKPYAWRMNLGDKWN